MAIAAGCTGSDGEGQQEQAAYQGIDTVPMLITQIKKCSRLYTTEMKVHKIVTHDDVVKLQGKLLKQNIDIKLPMGERKVAIPIDATLKAYIDFSDFSERNIERTADGKMPMPWCLSSGRWATARRTSPWPTARISSRSTSVGSLK